jgi:hypothetical protein
VTRPQEVETLRELKVLKVACGVWHTAAVVEHTTADGLSSLNRLYTWGDGDKCRLGHGNKVCFLSVGQSAKVWISAELGGLAHHVGMECSLRHENKVRFLNRSGLK